MSKKVKNTQHVTYLNTVSYASFLDKIGYPEPQSTHFATCVKEGTLEGIEDLQRRFPEIYTKLMNWNEE